MGSAASLNDPGSNEGKDLDTFDSLAPPGRQRRESTTHKAGRIRQSVMFNDELLGKGKGGGIVPSNGMEISSNIFQIRVPHGIIPGGTFSAICQHRYVKVQVPEDAQPGDLIEIDLTGIESNTEGPPHAEVAQDTVQVSKENEVSDNTWLSSSIEQDEEKRLKKAAALFIKYGGAEKYEINLSQLEDMLEKEFKFPPGSDLIKKEMALADVDKDQTITFEEFNHWLTHLEMRLEVHRLQEQQKLFIQQQKEFQALKESHKEVPASPKNKSENDSDDDDDDDDDVRDLRDAEEEERRIIELQKEQEKIRLQVEKQREDFMLEIEALRKEKERLEKQKDELATLQEQDALKLADYEQRNDQKLKLMEEHHHRNEIMIEKMKQDYLALNNRRKSEVTHKKEEARKKLEAKRSLRKKELATCRGCGGAKRACGCPRKVYHCEHCPDSQGCDDCKKE